MRHVLARTLSYMCPDFLNSNDMKRLILMLALVSVGFIGSAQKKETRQERVERWKNDMEAFQQRRMKSMAIYDFLFDKSAYCLYYLHQRNHIAPILSNRTNRLKKE